MAEKRAGIALHTKILIGLVAGALVGGTLNLILGAKSEGLVFAAEQIAYPIGQLFIRLLLLLVVPLVFSSLALGVAGLGDLRRIGRIGIKSLVYTIVFSTISVVIGLTLANTIRPGKRIDPAVSEQLNKQFSTVAAKTIESATAAKAK
ncbi:MAG TPA: cation:dicarboxylase symporter family transporter, partial [Thermoanaerobaculia bacterium]|nr:cation:dicarboxylase symporter family transporter [Thermoanaerobaculia bacterium]